MSGGIFISYRRGNDSGTTGRLADELKKTFDDDRVFFDVDSIELGLDFIKVIEDRISKSDVLLAVMGQQWLDARDRDGKRRLDNPKDPVRIEIEAAINQNKRVIPVLIDDTKIPEPDSLPDSLRVLSGRNATTVSNDRFRDDTARLTRQLRHIFGEDGQTQYAPVGVMTPVGPLQDGKPSSAPQSLFKGKMLLASVLVVLLGLAGATYAVRNRGGDVPSPGRQGWCNDPNLRPEELRVCATPSLLALDDQLGALYTGLKKRLPSEPGQALSADENRWLNETRHACIQDESCLTRVYQERITYLKNYPAQR